MKTDCFSTHFRDFTTHFLFLPSQMTGYEKQESFAPFGVAREAPSVPHADTMKNMPLSSRPLVFFLCFKILSPAARLKLHASR